MGRMCKDCSDSVSDEHNTACFRCREFRDRLRKMVQTRPSAFYKIMHEELAVYQMVCVSKTVMGDY